MGTTVKVQVAGATVGQRITWAIPVQAPEPKPGPDGTTKPWPRRTIGYSGAVGTIIRIGPRTGPIAELEECGHRHPRAMSALRCADKRFLADGERPPRPVW